MNGHYFFISLLLLFSCNNSSHLGESYNKNTLDISRVCKNNLTCQASVVNNEIAKIKEGSKSAMKLTFPKGQWKIAGSIILHSNMTILGVGTITQISPNTPTFKGSELRDLNIKEITLLGYGIRDSASCINRDAGTTNAKAHGISIIGSSKVTIQNCKISNHKNAGIFIQHSSDVTILKNVISGTYPDEDIPFGDTRKQQFGLIIYSRDYSKIGSNPKRTANRTAQAHGSKNISISNNRISNTAIGICVFPGYSNVKISENITEGALSQHSIYTYPDAVTVIDNNTLHAKQNVGIKLSIAHGAVQRGPNSIQITNNSIQNTYAPAISFETHFYFKDTLRLDMSSVFFHEPLISGNEISNFHDIGIAISCTTNGYISNNIFENQNNVISTSHRPVINMRNFTGTIVSNKISNTERDFLGGSVGFVGETIIQDNTLKSISKSKGTSIISLSPAPLPLQVIKGTWIAKGTPIMRSGEIISLKQSGVIMPDKMAAKRQNNSNNRISVFLKGNLVTSTGATVDYFAISSSRFLDLELESNTFAGAPAKIRVRNQSRNKITPEIEVISY